MREIALIAHNVRSSQNVGSMLRTAEGLNAKVILSGYTPYPTLKNDPRLPHEAAKTSRQISKTALGAESNVKWDRVASLENAVQNLKKEGFIVAALEQTKSAKPLNEFKPQQKIAIIVGNEVSGLDKSELELADLALEIPMLGKKESFNVSVASAIALFHLRFAK